MAEESINVINLCVDQGIMPLFYEDSFEKSLGIVRVLYESGMRVIEYINRGPMAYENFRRLKLEACAEMPGLILGAGTIRNTEEVYKFADIGADFLVSPCFDPWIATIAADLKLLWIPGCFTPTEVHTAWKQGIRLIKLFPASVLGPGFVKAIKEVYPELIFMPSGGVSIEKENLNAWFTSGASLVAMGTGLITRQIKMNGDYTALAQKSREAMALVELVRSKTAV